MEILPQYFLLSMLIAYIILYLTYPNPQIILKYPTIDNDVSDTYIDANNVCYKYHKKQIPCKTKR